MSELHPHTPKVTVLMTLFNKGRFVSEAIRSVLSSSFADLEVLVVDDASTDNGPSQVAAFTDPRVRMLRSERNTGRPSAANRGYDAARGTYIAVMDADDVIHPERLARQVAFMDAHPDVGAVGSWLPAFGTDDRTFATPPDDAACRALALFGMPVIYPSCMLRRAVLDEHGVRCDPTWLLPGMDYLFMLKVGRHAAYANLQEPLTYYRVGEQNMRHGRDPVSDARILYREVLTRFGLPASDAQVEAHLALQSTFDIRMSRALVHEVVRWMAELRQWNARSGWCPTNALEAELTKRWERVFHAAADQDLRAAMAHVQHGPDDRMAHVRHALRKAWYRRMRR